VFLQDNYERFNDMEKAVGELHEGTKQALESTQSG